MKMLSFVDGKRIYIFIFHKEEEGNNGYSICFVDKNDVKSSVKLTQDEKQDFLRHMMPPQLGLPR